MLLIFRHILRFFEVYIFILFRKSFLMLFNFYIVSIYKSAVLVKDQIADSLIFEFINVIIKILLILELSY